MTATALAERARSATQDSRALFPPWTGPPRLERRIEAWLKKTFGVEVEFAVDEALAKLDRLGVLIPHGRPPRGSHLDEALARLDCVWCDFFRKPAA
jgi:hypothetical protein